MFRRLHPYTQQQDLCTLFWLEALLSRRCERSSEKLSLFLVSLVHAVSSQVL